MRKTLQHILASALLVGGLAACGEHGSPTAPPIPTEDRRYIGQFTIQDGLSRVDVRYDQTWAGREGALRSEVEKGLRDGIDLIEAQVPFDYIPRVSISLRAQGLIDKVPFDTSEPYGLYALGSRDGFTICADAPGYASISECVAHQLQHAYASVNNKDCAPNVLHYNPRTTEFVPSTTTVLCKNVTNIDRPDIVAERVSQDDCQTDG